VYGLTGGHDFVAKMIDFVLQHRLIPCPIGLPAGLSPIWLNDASRILYDLSCNRQESNRTITVNGPHEYSLAELMRLVARISGKPVHLLPVPRRVMRWLYYLLRLNPLQGRLVADQIPRLYCAKDRQNLGYELRVIDDFILERYRHVSAEPVAGR
jgi:uncharacterized protein YbjT (DUF2867 family)